LKTRREDSVPLEEKRNERRQKESGKHAFSVQEINPEGLFVFSQSDA
jgi:hypothetical protein